MCCFVVKKTCLFNIKTLSLEIIVVADQTNTIQKTQDCSIGLYKNENSANNKRFRSKCQLTNSFLALQKNITSTQPSIDSNDLIPFCSRSIAPTKQLNSSTGRSFLKARNHADSITTEEINFQI